MTPDEIRQFVSLLDTTSTSEGDDAWNNLRPLGEEVVPYLLEAYPRTKKWQGRVRLVFHAMRYARVSMAAYELGIAALNDKATLVRYRACMLLACSLNDRAIPHLKGLYNHHDRKTVDDARAAVDAIRSSNRNYFLDRSHTVNITLEFGGESNLPPAVMKPAGSTGDPLADYTLASVQQAKPQVSNHTVDTTTLATGETEGARVTTPPEGTTLVQRIRRWMSGRG